MSGWGLVRASCGRGWSCLMLVAAWMIFSLYELLQTGRCGRWWQRLSLLHLDRVSGPFYSSVRHAREPLFRREPQWSARGGGRGDPGTVDLRLHPLTVRAVLPDKPAVPRS